MGRSVNAVLQFGGASGGGYLAQEEVDEATAELKKIGTFKDGIFRRNDDAEGRRNLDGYQAIWEHTNGRRMEYPEPRYRDPIMVDPANYEWLPIAGMSGVAEKPLGTFTERRCAAMLVQLAGGAVYHAGERSVYLVLSGAGLVQNEDYRPYTALHLDHDEQTDVAAREETEIVRLVLPDLSGLQARQPTHVIAAE